MAVKAVKAIKIYTVVAIYQDNQQRYATTVEANSPKKAAVEANIVASTDCFPREPINPAILHIVGIFEGEHAVVDMRASQADEPPPSKSRPKKKAYPMTIVTRDRAGGITTYPVEARSPEQAELEEAFDYPDTQVAGILAGHLKNLHK